MSSPERRGGGVFGRRGRSNQPRPRRDATTVLGAEFGAPNPQKTLQHMKLQGHAQVYLMARFVGEE
jgi:hypothetical protein